MTNSAFSAYPFPNPERLLQAEAPFTIAQRGFESWSRAATQVANGLMSAGMAQLELARSIYAVAPVDAATTLPSHGLHAAGLEWLRTTHSRLDTAVKGYRQINDDLMATLFSAVETVIDAVPDEIPAMPMVPVAAPKQAAAA